MMLISEHLQQSHVVLKFSTVTKKICLSNTMRLVWPESFWPHPTGAPGLVKGMVVLIHSRIRSLTGDDWQKCNRSTDSITRPPPKNTHWSSLVKDLKLSLEFLWYKEHKTPSGNTLGTSHIQTGPECTFTDLDLIFPDQITLTKTGSSLSEFLKSIIQ